MIERIVHNKRMITIQTVVILAAMVGLLSFLGVRLFGGSALLYAGIIGGTFLLFGRRATSSILFETGTAIPLSYYQAPELYRITERLSSEAGLSETPQLGYIRSPVMNALSVGNRDDAAIIVTEGLVRRLSPRELAGVIAHEISHVKNSDLGILTFSDTLRRMTGVFSQVGLLLLIVGLPFLLFSGAAVPVLFVLALIAAPLISLLLQLALSRGREFTADIGAVELTGDPEGLASALAKIHSGSRSFLEQLFGARTDERSLFRTHPATEERLMRLRNLRRSGDEHHGHRRLIRYT